MAQINIKDENIRNLMAIQKVIYFEEGQETSLDDALSRALEFYRRFVPFN